MSTTPNIGLEILIEGQANKEASISEAHQQLDALVQAGVIDRDLTAPPGSPAEGDRYLVAAGATGAWAGQDGNITHYRNGAWTFITPREGWRLWVDDENRLLAHDGASWEEVGGAISVEEEDGSPSIAKVTKIKVGNGDLTDEGGGVVRLKTAADAGAQGASRIEALLPRASVQADNTQEFLQVTLPAAIDPGDVTALEFEIRNLVTEIDGETLAVTLILDDDTETGAVWSLEGFIKSNGSSLSDASVGPSSVRNVGSIGNASGEFLNYRLELMGLNNADNPKQLRETVSYYLNTGGGLRTIFSTVAVATSKKIKGLRIDTDSAGDLIVSGTLTVKAAISGGDVIGGTNSAIKLPVRCTAAADVDISTELEAGDVIDGVTLAAGDRVLLAGQSDATENGVYVAVSSGAASRAEDLDADADLVQGQLFAVAEGAQNAGTLWQLATAGPFTLGTTNLSFVRITESLATLVEEAGSSRTLGTDDNKRIVHFTNAGTGVTVTVPDSLPEGFSCDVVNETGGSMAVSAGGTLTIVGDTSIAQNRAAQILRIKNTKANVASL